MTNLISRYIHIITQETNVLLKDEINQLNPIQCNTIHSIHEYINQLCVASIMLSEASYNEAVRHQLLDLLTPISGYVEMLADGWMGELNLEQRDRINLIFAAVHRLTHYIRSQIVEKKESLLLSQALVISHPVK